MTEHELRQRLGYWVQGMGGGAQDPGWLEAFQSVPRHVLVPEGWCDRPDGGRYRSEDMTPDEWLDTVYRDLPIFIRDAEQGLSSSSMPSIMGRMLDMLKVEDHSTVLEIGTGSGYNAALLSHRLGADRVTSIDIEPDLVSIARERLASIGYEPHLAVADGPGGYPARAPYDRVIGTCRVWPVPRSWIEQTRPGGRVAAVVPDGCVGLDVRDEGSAVGRFHPGHFSFMPMRGWMPELVGDLAAGDTRSWSYPPDVLRAGGAEQASFMVLVRGLVWPHGHCWPTWEMDKVEGLISYADASWVRFDREARTVTEGGSRQLWGEIEGLFDEWCRLGCPNRERFGLTVSADGAHTLWLDHPDSEHRWEVTPGPRGGAVSRL
jgi:protein-L-isoaspartate O-methyltransferase